MLTRTPLRRRASAARDGWHGDAATAPTARSAQVQRARAGQRRRAVGRRSSCAAHGARRARPRRRCAWSRAATSSCRAVRPRPRLHLPEPRQADHLRDPLRGRLHADRHHRRRAPTAPIGAGAHRRRRDRLPVRAGQPLLRAPGRRRPTWSGPTPACGRCSTTTSGDPSAVTRDYLLELDTDAAPLLSVWGGKITTFRKLAEEAADQLAPACSAKRAPRGPRGALLPGGDLSRLDRRRRSGPTPTSSASCRRSRCAIPSWPAALRAAAGARLRRARRARCSAGDGLGAEVAPGLYEAELRLPARRRNGRAAPTTCCGAAPSSACT